MDELRKILVTGIPGAKEYVGAKFTVSDGSDLTGDPVEISLGGPDLPTAWQDISNPKVVVSYGANSATISLLVDNAVAPGYYYVWVRLTDNPEVLPRRVERVQVI